MILKLKLIGFLFLCNTAFGYSQEIEKNSNIILTFIINKNSDNHKNVTYKWLISAKNLKQGILDYSPFYNFDYPLNYLNTCINKDSTYIFTSVTGSNWDFTEEYISNIEDLRKITNDNRVLLQKITKKNKSGRKEKIKIYATPVIGDFCNCPIKHEDGKMIKYQGNIFLPVGKFKYGSKFWDSKEAKYILDSDLSQFKIYTYPTPYSYRHPMF